MFLEQLQKPEQEIVKALTAEDIQRLASLRVDNLTKRKAAIVGVRSEDLWFLLKSVHEGALPAQGSTKIRGKSPGFFVTANPESGYLKAHHPEVVAASIDKTFKRAAMENARLYAHEIAVAQAVSRALFPLFDQAQLEEELRKRIPDTTTELSRDNLYEDFWGDLVKDIQGLTKEKFSPHRFPDINFLLSRIANIPPASALKFLENLNKRSGVCIAFNEKLLASQKIITHQASEANVGCEMVIEVPDNRLSLETIEGFEVLGEAEESLLDRLGII